MISFVMLGGIFSKVTACNFYNVDMLISGDLMKRLRLGSQFQIKTLGENELKGKDEKVELFSIG